MEGRGAGALVAGRVSTAVRRIGVPESTRTPTATIIPMGMVSSSVEHGVDDRGTECSYRRQPQHADAELDAYDPYLKASYLTVAEETVTEHLCRGEGWKTSSVDGLEKEHRIDKEFVANVLKRECEGDGNCLYRSFSDQVCSVLNVFHADGYGDIRECAAVMYEGNVPVPMLAASEDNVN